MLPGLSRGSGDGYLVIPDNQESDNVQVVAFLIPNAEWVLPVTSLISMLTAGRVWVRDGRPDSIRRAQQIGECILTSFSSCSLQDLVSGLADIKTAISSLSFAVSTSVTCCDYSPPGDVPDNPELPTPGGDPDDYILPPGIEPGEYDSLVCDLVNGVLGLLYTWLDQLSAAHWYTLGLWAIVALLAALFPEPVTTALGTVAFAAIAGAMLSAVTFGSQMSLAVNDMLDWLGDNGQEIVCDIQTAVNLAEGIHAMAERLVVTLRNFLVARGLPDILADILTAWLAANQLIEAVIADFVANGVTSLPQPPDDMRISCDCTVPPCECGECYGDLLACFAVGSILDSPASVTMASPSTGVVVDWSYDGVYLVLEIVATGQTSYANPTVTFSFAAIPNYSQVERVVKLVSCDAVIGGPGDVTIEGRSVTNNDRPFVFAGSSRSSERACMAVSLANAGETVVGDVDGDIGSVVFTMARPGSGNTTVINAVLRYCWGGVLT